MAVPEPTEVAPWYLRNITQALELNSATGQVFVRTNAAIVGNVTVGNVSIGSLGNVDLTHTYLPVSVTGNILGIVNPVSVTGNVGVSGNVGIVGNVNVTQGTSPWSVSGNVTAVVASGNVTVAGNPAQVTAFAEPLAIPITPLIQTDAVYGLDPDVWDQIQINGGTVASGNSVWTVSSGTSANGFSVLKTARFVRYQPGQGAMARFTAAFTITGGSGATSQGVTNAPQIAGFISKENGYGFGFSGDATDNKFGIVHRYGGVVEVRTLTLTQFNTGAQTATVTLNGTAYTVSLTTSTSTNYLAAQLANKLMAISAVANLWEIDACGSTVTFGYYTAAPTNGTFSFSSTGTGTLAAGTFARTMTGVSPTQDWTYLADWDQQPTNFNPNSLNVFAIDFRWLGVGIVRFFVEDPATGDMMLVRIQKWSSQYLVPHLANPSLRLSYSSGAVNGSTPAVNAVVRGASVMGGIQGIVAQTTQSLGYSFIKTTQSTKDDVHHIMSVQNPYIRGSQVNTSSLVMQSMSVSQQGQDPSIIYIVVNATGTSDYLVFNPIPGANAQFNFAQVSNTAVTENLAVDTQNNIQSLGINGGVTFDLMPYNFNLAPGDYISVFISSGSAINRVSCGLTWKVD